MTDRELLELAAKAAGIDPATFEGRDMGWYIPDRQAAGSWNPLNDDGDALRLAVKLGIYFKFYADKKRVRAFNSEGTNLVALDFGLSDFDQLASTRRAIVLCAAEIGRLM